jgi:transcriptional regulator with XRE-family HTH domain
MGKLAKRIKDAREDLQISVRELASRLDVSPGYISRIEARGEIPSPELLCRIGAELKVQPEELLDLAKLDLLARTRDNISEKHAEALRLFRRSK